MLVNGDKLVVTKNVMGILNEGDIVKVIDVNENGLIRFAFGDGFMHMGFMNTEECEKHFEKVVEEAPKVTAERIEEILEDAEIESYTVFDKCTVVACKLPNGFVIVESSACVSPENYDETLGFEICLEKIENKVWELEGYRLQEELYRKSLTEECSYDCDNCLCNECEEDIDLCNKFTECSYEEADCNYCREYNCPNNTMS